MITFDPYMGRIQMQQHIYHNTFIVLKNQI